MKILTDESGKKWEVVAPVFDDNCYRLRPLPEPRISLDEEVRQEAISISGGKFESVYMNCQVSTLALCRVLERRLAELEKKG